MKNKFFIISITVIMTSVIILLLVFFLFGFNKRLGRIMSVESPDGIYTAYAIDEPALDPPNQSLFLSRNGTDEFRLVSALPEDIEYIKQIVWSPDGRNVVFITNWHLIITDVERFNSVKISLNEEWWRWNENRKTFSTTGRSVEMIDFYFIGSDTLLYRTDEMETAVKVCIAGD